MLINVPNGYTKILAIHIFVITHIHTHTYQHTHTHTHTPSQNPSTHTPQSPHICAEPCVGWLVTLCVLLLRSVTELNVAWNKVGTYP